MYSLISKCLQCYQNFYIVGSSPNSLQNNICQDSYIYSNDLSYPPPSPPFGSLIKWWWWQWWWRWRFSFAFIRFMFLFREFFHLLFLWSFFSLKKVVFLLSFLGDSLCFKRVWCSLVKRTIILKMALSWLFWFIFYPINNLIYEWR